MTSAASNDRLHQHRVLDVFTDALSWRRYLARMLAPFVRGDVVEVGTGLGVNTFGFAGLARRIRTCPEPDPDLAAEDEKATREADVSLRARVVVGTADDLSSDRRFDAVIYRDVLEQMQDEFWDAIMVPLSRILDPLLRYRAGKTIRSVRRRPEISPHEDPLDPAGATENAGR